MKEKVKVMKGTNKMFRWWSEKRQVFHYHALRESGGEQNMQFTGHEDKSGAPIFEGDYIGIDGRVGTYEVKWINDHGVFAAVPGSSMNAKDNHVRIKKSNVDKMMVVGNVKEGFSLNAIKHPGWRLEAKEGRPSINDMYGVPVYDGDKVVLCNLTGVYTAKDHPIGYGNLWMGEQKGVAMVNLADAEFYKVGEHKVEGEQGTDYELDTNGDPVRLGDTVHIFLSNKTSTVHRMDGLLSAWFTNDTGNATVPLNSVEFVKVEVKDKDKPIGLKPFEGKYMQSFGTGRPYASKCAFDRNHKLVREGDKVKLDGDEYGIWAVKYIEDKGGLFAVQDRGWFVHHKNLNLVSFEKVDDKPKEEPKSGKYPKAGEVHVKSDGSFITKDSAGCEVKDGDKVLIDGCDDVMTISYSVLMGKFTAQLHGICVTILPGKEFIKCKEEPKEEPKVETVTGRTCTAKSGLKYCYDSNGDYVFIGDCIQFDDDDGVYVVRLLGDLFGFVASRISYTGNKTNMLNMLCMEGRKFHKAYIKNTLKEEPKKEDDVSLTSIRAKLIDIEKKVDVNSQRLDESTSRFIDLTKAALDAAFESINK